MVGLDCKKKEFTFGELPADIQEDIIEETRNSDYYLDYDWYQYVYEDYEQQLNNNGYHDIKINFSGFWSQGDGASFTAKSIDIAHFIEKWKDDFGFLKWVCVDSDFIEISAYVKRISNHYSHENTCSVCIDSYGEFIEEEAEEYIPWFKVKIIEAFGGDHYILDKINELEEAIEEDRKEWCKKIYRALGNEYEFLMSDETIKDHIECNDFRYDEEGNNIL